MTDESQEQSAEPPKTSVYSIYRASTGVVVGVIVCASKEVAEIAAAGLGDLDDFKVIEGDHPIGISVVSENGEVRTLPLFESFQVSRAGDAATIRVPDGFLIEALQKHIRLTNNAIKFRFEDSASRKIRVEVQGYAPRDIDIPACPMLARIEVIKRELEGLDARSLRPWRAVIAAQSAGHTAPDAESEMLANIENNARELRLELAQLISDIEVLQAAL